MKLSLFFRCSAFAAGSLLVWSTAHADAPLVAGPLVKIPDSKGKFDFLEIDAARHRLLAAHEKDGTADFIDLDANTLITRIKTGPTVGIAADMKGGKYYASVQDDKRVAIIDATTLQETGSIAMEGETDAILFEAKDHRVYVTNDNGKYLWAIDTTTGKVAASIDIPGTPECMAHDKGADRIYLNLKSTNQVAVVDTKTNTIVTLWAIAPAVAPHGLVLDAAAGRVFVSGDNGKLVALDLKTGQVVSSVDITPHVDQIAIDTSLHRVYCAGPDKMSVVDVSGTALVSLGDVKTAANAKNVAVDSKTHTVWTTYTDGTDSWAASFHAP